MEFQQIRGATVKITYGNSIFLVDPFFAAKDEYPPLEAGPFPDKRWPIVNLPMGIEEIIAGYKRLIGRAKKAGIRVVGATILPAKGCTYYGGPYKDSMRQEVNKWIRTEAPYDCVLDYDKAICDEKDPLMIKKGCSLHDRIHPNKRGGEILARSVDMKLLFKD